MNTIDNLGFSVLSVCIASWRLSKSVGLLDSVHLSIYEQYCTPGSTPSTGTVTSILGDLWCLGVCFLFQNPNPVLSSTAIAAAVVLVPVRTIKTR